MTAGRRWPRPAFGVGAVTATFFGLRRGYQSLIKRRYRILGGLIDSIANRLRGPASGRTELRVEADTPV